MLSTVRQLNFSWLQCLPMYRPPSPGDLLLFNFTGCSILSLCFREFSLLMRPDLHYQMSFSVAFRNWWRFLPMRGCSRCLGELIVPLALWFHDCSWCLCGTERDVETRFKGNVQGFIFSTSWLDTEDAGSQTRNPWSGVPCFPLMVVGPHH